MEIAKKLTGEEDYGEDYEEITTITRRRGKGPELGQITENLNTSLDNLEQPMSFINKYYKVEKP